MEKVVVEENTQKKRIDSYIVDKNINLSRTAIKRLLDEGKILVNGKKQKPSYKPEVGDIITIEIPEPEEVELKPQDIPIDVIYEY